MGKLTLPESAVDCDWPREADMVVAAAILRMGGMELEVTVGMCWMVVGAVPVCWRMLEATRDLDAICWASLSEKRNIFWEEGQLHVFALAGNS